VCQWQLCAGTPSLREHYPITMPRAKKPAQLSAKERVLLNRLSQRGDLRLLQAIDKADSRAVRRQLEEAIVERAASARRGRPQRHCDYAIAAIGRPVACRAQCLLRKEKAPLRWAGLRPNHAALDRGRVPIFRIKAIRSAAIGSRKSQGSAPRTPGVGPLTRTRPVLGRRAVLELMHA